MADDQKKIIPINYTNRDYTTIRKDLMTIAERLYPDTFQDFSEGSFGAMMLDAVAYVGDQLSFYLDYNVNETFLDTAYQYNNVLRHGRILGYKDTGIPSTYGKVALFVLVPSTTTGLGPDTDYIPILKRGTRFSSTTRGAFVLLENIDFGDPENVTLIARVNEANGSPTHYAIKASGNVVSGFFSQESIRAGSFQRYKRLAMKASNVAEILSVVDSSGNEYYEVDYLSQDIIFKELSNSNYKNDNVPSIMKPYLVSRKFIVERTNTGRLILQFGTGKDGETNVAAEPQSVALDVFGKDYVSATTFDPTKLTKNENFGVVPYDTVLTITYRATSAVNSNTGVGTINDITSAEFEFADESSLEPAKMQDVIRSLEVNNEEPIIGNVTIPDSTEVKRRIYDTFPTQNRAVTQADYESLVYRMPAKYGSIKRVSAQKDPDSLKRNLNIYVISEDSSHKLTTTNSTIKNNLKTWLNHYRMINDTIDILDPYIINLGIQFIVKPQVNANKYVILDACVNALTMKYKTNFYIGEPLYISDIYQELKGVTGVLDVVKVKLVNKTGSSYSSVVFDINKNLSSDGDHLVIPKNAIVEFKYPSIDITGKIR
tara:strand:- start:105 stop:1904 length:1800 start_codon:yes stop_codon:yes gene_type:complete